MNSLKQCLKFSTNKSKPNKNCDYLIVGGGIIGLTIAREILKSSLNSSVTIIDKHKILCSQASTNNSGVIHAGFYYSADSLKAKFCTNGNSMLTKYCKDNKIPFRNCGKLVIANSESEYSDLLSLYERGKANNVNLELIDFAKASKIEPTLNISRQENSKFPVIFSPNTSIASQTSLRDKLVEEVLSYSKANIITSCSFEELISKNEIQTSLGNIQFNYLINCAGTNSDKIAKKFGFCQNYITLPFKGSYLYDSSAKMNTLVYPVPPNMGNNFLGVHYTITLDRKVKIGPSAYPSLFREIGDFSIIENYFEPFELCYYYLKCIASGERLFYLKQLKNEFRKFFKKSLVSDAGKLCKLHENDILDYNEFKWGNPGIRAQLINSSTMKLETDFIIEGDKNSIHLLNIISPGWTCSMAIAENIIKTEIPKKLNINEKSCHT